MTARKQRLNGVGLKLYRAEEHLDAIRKVGDVLCNGQCSLVPKLHPNGDASLVVSLFPHPPFFLSVVIGDCLFNLRSSLDHLVCCLVESNPPHVVTRQNQFPICSNPGAFKVEVEERKRLDGVHKQAVAAIEALQPYGTPDHPLAVLNRLHIVDKHRMLNLTMAAASQINVMWRMGTKVDYVVIGIAGLHHGADFGTFNRDDPIAGMIRKPGEVEVYGEASLFIALQDSVVPGSHPLNVVASLEEIGKFIGDTVVPALEPFIS